MEFARAEERNSTAWYPRDLRQALATQPEGSRAALQALRRGDAGTVVGTVVADCRDAEPGAAQERLARLGADLAASGESIVDYRLRLRALGHAVNPGWRGLGAAEATVKRYKHRIAKRGRSWSVRGLGAMITLLDKLYDGTLRDKVSGLSVEKEPAAPGPRRLPPGEVPQAVGRGSPGRQAHLPALDGRVTGWATVLRELSRVQQPC